MSWLEDITAPKVIEIVISYNGKTVWVNTESRCKFRACKIGKLVIDDRRRYLRKKKKKVE